MFRINTLGFRGEALPSIASVSKVKMITSHGEEGYGIEISGGTVLSHGLNTARKGTEISVRNLFFNTPARLKFLKSLNVELSNIADYVTRVAISYPNISFNLSNNGKSLVKTDGSNNLLKVVSSVYGVSVAKSMIEVACKNYDYSVSGYISEPTLTRSNKKYINIVINNRVINNFIISSKLSSSYGNRIPKGRYPVVVLNIKCDPLLVDVNVHPSKMQVKLTDERELTKLIKETVKSILTSIVSIPSMMPKQQENSAIKDNYVIKEQLSFDYNASENEHIVEFPRLEYVGQFHGTYLLCQGEKDLYIIDQHAAAERVKYEKYLAALESKNADSYELIVPINIEYSKSDFLKISTITEKLKEQGITISESGFNSFYLREVPIWFETGLEKEYLDSIISSLVDEKSNSKIDQLASLLACKKSVKANDYLSSDEVLNLIEDLAKCDNPFTCPHGRPTLIKYTIAEIERFFRR